MNGQPAPWRRTMIGAFGAEVATDEKGQRHLAIATPDGAVTVYVFTAENAQTIGYQLAAPGIAIPDFPPDQ